MKDGLRLLLFVGVLAVFVGCASKGFNRGDLQSQMGVAKPVYDDQAIKAAYNKKPNLPKPFRLAVYFKNPQPQAYQKAEWRWTEEDKAVLESIGLDLQSKGMTSDVFPLIGATVDSTDLRSLRVAAAQHKADALLIIHGAGDVDRYTNKWGWSYLLIAPALFVPGSEADTLFISSATMWDVKNEYLYLTAEVEATGKETYIAAFGSTDKDLLAEAKKQSLLKLKSELTKQIQGTKISSR